MKNYVYLSLLMLMAFVFTACPVKNERLPQEVAPLALPELPISIIQVPLVLKTEALKMAFKQAFPNPVLEGKTKELALQLAGKKKEADQNFWDKLTTPVLKWVDKTFEVTSSIAYKANLSAFDIWFEGTKFYADLLLDFDARVELKNGLLLFGEKTQLNGDLKCPLQVKMFLEGDVELNEDVEIVIHLNDNNTRVKFQKLCSNKTIQGLNYPELFQPIVAPLKKQVSLVVNKLIARQLQQLLSKHVQHNYLNFQEQINQIAQQIGQPHQLMEQVWLIPAVQQVFVSPINGTGKGRQNQLRFCVGVKAKPQVQWANEQPNIVLPSSMDFAVQNYATQTSIYVNGKLPLSYASSQLQTFLKAYIDQNYAQYGYTIGKTTIYPCREKVALAVEVLKAKTGKLKAVLYLWGIPKYDAQNQEVYIDGLDFTAQSKNILIKFAAWMMQPKIMKTVKQNARFSLAEQLTTFRDQLKQFNHKEELGTLRGSFDYMDIHQVFVSEHDLEVYWQMDGKLDFDINWSAQK